MTFTPSHEPFVVMAKPAGADCNLACPYCYYSPHGAGQAGSSPVMSDETLEDFTKNLIESSPGPVVQINWHGGEPTLAGKGFFRKAVSLQKKHLPKDWECWNSIQTNGTLLDEEWCSFLRSEGFHVGLSIDGDEAVHDAQRPAKDGRGSHSRAMRAASLLREAGISPDLLCTVTSLTARDPLRTYGALRSVSSGWMQFIPVVRRNPDGSVSADSVAPQEYGNFLKEIFREWILGDSGDFLVQQFAEMFLVISGAPPTVCWMSQTCGRVLVVERDGSVFSCDHFAFPENRLGNVSDDSLASLVDGPVQTAFGKKKRDGLSAKCLACPHLDMCRGACPKDRFPDAEGGVRQYLCEGLRSFFGFSRNALSVWGESMLARGSAARHREKVTEPVLRSSRNMWRGVSPKDACPCGSGLAAKDCCWSVRIHSQIRPKALRTF